MISSNARHTVVSEATGPNTSSWWRQHVDISDRLTGVSDHHSEINQYPSALTPITPTTCDGESGGALVCRLVSGNPRNRGDSPRDAARGEQC